MKRKRPECPGSGAGSGLFVYTMSQVQKGVYTVNEKMTELKSFYKLVKYVWEKLVAVCGERILAFA